MVLKNKYLMWCGRWW